MWTRWPASISPRVTDVVGFRERFLQRLEGWASGGTTTHRTMLGIPVTILNTEPSIRTDQVVARLDQALGLIEAHAPRRLARLRRDLSQIVVRRFPCRGAFFPQERACLTELTFVVNPAFTPAQVASSIVHEATHARVAASLRSDVVNRRPREERLCRQAELAFGLALPRTEGEAVVARARASLASADEDVAPEVDWAEAWQRVEDVDRRR